MRVSLLRHGSTEVMKTHLCGRTAGIPLSERGLAEARALAKRLATPDLLISSPVQRAVETAEAIGRQHGPTAVICAAFTEFDFGAWTGHSFDSLHAEPLWDAFNRERETTRAPSGELMSEVLARAVQAVNELAVLHPNKQIAIVSHGDVIRSLLVHAAQTGLGSFWRFTVDPASITELEWHSGASVRILRANDTAHLESLSAA